MNASPLARCMGGKFCNHVPGTCTATVAQAGEPPAYVTPPWERMWFDPECAEDGCQSLIWKARYEAAVQGRQDFRNAYAGQLKRVKLLLGALHEIEALGSDGEHSGDRHARCREIARAAILKEREAQ